MKKLFFVLVLAAILSACGGDANVKDFAANSIAAVQAKKAPVYKITHGPVSNNTYTFDIQATHATFHLCW